MARDEEAYIIEFIQIGKSVKVSAFDPVTLTEVSIVGPVKAPKSQLKQIALQKLLYVIAKNDPQKNKPTPRDPGKKGGIMV